MEANGQGWWHSEETCVLSSEIRKKLSKGSRRNC